MIQLFNKYYENQTRQVCLPVATSFSLEQAGKFINNYTPVFLASVPPASGSASLSCILSRASSGTPFSQELRVTILKSSLVTSLFSYLAGSLSTGALGFPVKIIHNLPLFTPHQNHPGANHHQKPAANEPPATPSFPLPSILPRSALPPGKPTSDLVTSLFNPLQGLPSHLVKVLNGPQTDPTSHLSLPGRQTHCFILGGGIKSLSCV